MSSNDAPDIENLFVVPLAPDEFMKSLSIIFNTWQLTEAQIESLIWGLAGVSTEKGRAITAHMTFPLRCDVLCALYHDRFKNKHADKHLRKIIEKHLRPSQSIRNKYAHGLWLKSRDGKYYFLEKEVRSRASVRPIEISLDSLLKDGIAVFVANLAVGAIAQGVDPSDLADKMFEGWPEESSEQAFQDALFPAEQYLRPIAPSKPLPPPRSSLE